MAECVEIGPCKLWLGDSLQLLADGAFDACDALVADPPYGIEKMRSSGGWKGGGKHTRRNSKLPVYGDDKPFDPQPLLSFDSVLLWGADHYAERLPRGRWLAWDKLGGMPTWDSFSDVEFAWHNKPGAARLFSLMWKGICQDKAGEGNGERWHPTQKPVALMEWCLEQAGTAPGDLVADMYLGSGTTGVACIRTGRRFIGCEIEERYFRIAEKRIRQAWDLKCSELPFEKPAPLVQRSLIEE